MCHLAGGEKMGVQGIQLIMYWALHVAHVAYHVLCIACSIPVLCTGCSACGMFVLCTGCSACSMICTMYWLWRM